jgi:hypothetical protein
MILPVVSSYLKSKNPSKLEDWALEVHRHIHRNTKLNIDLIIAFLKKDEDRENHPRFSSTAKI